MTNHFLFLSQVYPPDAAAVGQHLADVAEALVAKGDHVTVVTSNRGYDDPTQKYQGSELRSGVQVIRLPFTSFGKASIGLRMLGGLSLTAQACVIGLMMPSLNRVLTTTTPPVGALAGLFLRGLRRVPFDFWLMDLNPDLAVSIGRARPGSLQVRLFDAMNRAVLRHARHIIALDSAMAERFRAKLAGARAPVVIPVWSPDDFPEPKPTEASPLRSQYGLTGKRVIMYSGNHSIAHPLDGLLRAAKQRNEGGQLRFVFVGGGVAKRPIDEWIAEATPKHVLSLPYQPLEQLHAYLSMADVQVVVVGPSTVGIVHPSKIYGAMAAGRPVLVIGPADSPAAELVREHEIGWAVEHGDDDRLEQILSEIESVPQQRLEQLGARARELAVTKYSRRHLIASVVDLIEKDAATQTQPDPCASCTS